MHCVCFYQCVISIFIHLFFVCGDVVQPANINPPSSMLVKCPLILEKELMDISISILDLQCRYASPGVGNMVVLMPVFSA